MWKKYHYKPLIKTHITYRTRNRNMYLLLLCWLPRIWQWFINWPTYYCHCMLTQLQCGNVTISYCLYTFTYIYSVVMCKSRQLLSMSHVHISRLHNSISMSLFSISCPKAKHELCLTGHQCFIDSYCSIFIFHVCIRQLQYLTLTSLQRYICWNPNTTSPGCFVIRRRLFGPRDPVKRVPVTHSLEAETSR